MDSSPPPGRYSSLHQTSSRSKVEGGDGEDIFIENPRVTTPDDSNNSQRRRRDGRTLLPTQDDDVGVVVLEGSDEFVAASPDGQHKLRRRSVVRSSLGDEAAAAAIVKDQFDNSATTTHDEPLSPAVYLFCACAAWNSCILGYDFGVSSLSAILVQSSLQLSDVQLSGYLGALDLWAMVGAATASFINERFGRRGCFAVTSVGFVLGDLIQATAQTYTWLMVGRSILGLSIGYGLAIDPMYISEISPAHVRGFLVSWSEIAINVGVIFGFASGIVFYHTPDAYAWRYMYATGALLPITMLILIKCCMPESPRWLLQKGRHEDARRVLQKLYPSSHNEEVVDAVARDIQDALAREEAAHKLDWKFLLCSPTPAYRRMLVAGVVAGMSQQVVGIAGIGNFLAFVLDKSGIHDRYWQALTLVGIQTMKTVVTLGASKLVDSWGRRILCFVSIAGIIASLLLLAVDFHLSLGATSSLAIAGLLGYMVFFAIGMGPCAWLIPSEVFTTSVRAKGTSLTTFANRAVSTTMASTFLELEKTITWSGVFLVLVGLSIIMAALIYVYVPETKGKSLEDMAVFFATITGDRSVLDHMESSSSSSPTKRTSRMSSSSIEEPSGTIEMKTIV